MRNAELTVRLPVVRIAPSNIHLTWSKTGLENSGSNVNITDRNSLGKVDISALVWLLEYTDYLINEFFFDNLQMLKSSSGWKQTIAVEGDSKSLLVGLLQAIAKETMEVP